MKRVSSRRPRWAKAWRGWRLGVAWAAVAWLGAAGCGGDGGVDAGTGGGIRDGATPPDAARSDASTVAPIPGDGECGWAPGERPTAALPPEHTHEHVIDLARWAIPNDGTGDPAATRASINEAIRTATDEGFDRIVLPAGTYLIGEATNDLYAAGIELQGDMTFVLEDGAVLRMAPNDRWNYCVISVEGNSNITIRGGEVVGDRAEHVYDGGAHDEGHGICVWTGVDRVLIEDIELREMTGDGVLIVGARGSDSAPERPTTNVTVRNAHIHHNRRQGVSIVGGNNIVVQDNHIHHIEGTAPQFGVDIEGAGRTDRDILVFRNRFHDNAGGDVVSASGRNVWIEENTMTQCQADANGHYDPGAPCELERQVDGPIIHWKNTDSVILNNAIRMQMRTVNGFWGILGYTPADGASRDNPVGNYVAGNTLFDAGIHMAHNMRYFVSNNTVHNGLILGYKLGCTRLEDNRINRTAAEHYKLREVAGMASGNILNRADGAPADADRELHFPMADDAPYRNSSPVYW